MPNASKTIGTLTVALTLALLAGCATADPQIAYDNRTVHIPMRDGVRLHTEISRPRGKDGPLPILLTRTPYGPWNNADGSHDFLDENYADLAEDGYIFVFQDIRGRNESEGEFVMLRPVRDPSDPDGVDNSTDAYDTIEWLLANVREHNGKVGMLGVSYPGWLAMMALIDPHPALTAVSPQASPADMYIGDDFAHRGAFRLSPSFGFAYMMESGKRTKRFKFDRYDVYEWYLELGPLSNANRLHLHGRFPTWNAFMAHPNYDDYWRSISLLPLLNQPPAVPVLNVAGWFDAEDFYGPMTIYDELEKRDEQRHNQLVVGPWFHGAWRWGKQEKWGNLDFGSPTAEFYRQQVQRAWFAHHLHGAPKPDLPEALVFETGGNRWSRFDEWPPTGLTDTRPIYLHADGLASFQAPLQGDAAVEYISDPAKPVPYTKRPIKGFWQSGGKLWKIEDQRFVDGRPDVATWVSPPLTEDVVVAGEIVVELFASTTGTDCDWIVKLIDVYPERYEPTKMGGYQLMVAGDVLRARFRNDYSQPEPLTPGEVTAFTFSLLDRHHRFRAGHRVMVQIQSTWFPLIDRNPQTFVNIPTATEADYQPATQRVYCSQPHASRILLPVLRD